jgi:hypothetical protein
MLSYGCRFARATARLYYAATAKSCDNAAPGAGNGFAAAPAQLCYGATDMSINLGRIVVGANITYSFDFVDQLPVGISITNAVVDPQPATGSVTAAYKKVQAT